MLSGPRIEPLGGMGKGVRDDKAYFIIRLAPATPHRGSRLVVRKNLLLGFHGCGFTPGTRREQSSKPWRIVMRREVALENPNRPAERLSPEAPSPVAGDGSGRDR